MVPCTIIYGNVQLSRSMKSTEKGNYLLVYVFFIFNLSFTTFGFALAENIPPSLNFMYINSQLLI